jgi:predicted transposase YdaD
LGVLHFKSALANRDDAAMELRAVLPPALVRQIDFATLEPLPGSFIDEHMRGSHADLLYTVQCAGHPQPHGAFAECG